MPLESATYISDLIATNPDGEDQGKFGDDHIRMLKSTLLATFPNITGAVTKTHTALNNLPDDTNTELSTINASIAAIEANIDAIEANPVVSDAAQKAVIDVIYPVGSVFIAVSAMTPPSATGVTWERIAEGRTLVGEGTGTDDNLVAKSFTGSTLGGEYEHTLTEAEMPSHRHGTDVQNVNNGLSGGDGRGGTAIGGQAAFTTFTGGDAAHNNIQPYLVTYIWKRTA